MKPVFVFRMKIAEQDRIPLGVENDRLLMGWPCGASLVQPGRSQGDIQTVVHQHYYPDDISVRRAASAARNLFMFFHEMKVGDIVLVPWKQRLVYIGHVAGTAAYESFDGEDFYARLVRWLRPDGFRYDEMPPFVVDWLKERRACYRVNRIEGVVNDFVASIDGTLGEEFAEGRLFADLESANEYSGDATQREAYVLARLGQGLFRRKVLSLWDGRCAVTGCAVEGVLRASHILAWRHSTDVERLDGHNGLPLVATLDALFDRYLISFDHEGSMLVSGSLDEAERNRLGLPMPLRKTPSPKQQVYLEQHRQAFQANQAKVSAGSSAR
jgi:hypothetical protein